VDVAAHARTRVGTVLAAIALITGVVAGCTKSTDGVALSPTTASGTATGSGAPSTGSASAAAPTVAPADFSDCSGDFTLSALNLPAAVMARLTFDCAKISVPLNYADPNGKKISIFVVRVHDKTVKPIGSLLINPGGPGASGVETALGLVPQLDNTLLKHFDLLGFDPRGVGSSTPVSCLTDAQKDTLNAASPDVLTSAGFTAAQKEWAGVAQACTSKYGSDLQYFNTVNTARDMDLIRQAVGDSKLNYLGFSYGTELGAQYLHLFPTHMRVAVLDGAVDPLTSDITSFADQLEGFEKAFDQFAAYCRKTAPCSSLGDPRTAVAKVVAKAKASPIPSSTDPRKATTALVDTAVLSALYSRSTWPTLGSALISAEAGDAKGVLALADQYNERYNGQYTNLSDANTTISCNDSAAGQPTDATIRATAASWAKRFPIFGLWSAASLFSCQDWQKNRTVPPLPTATTTPRKVLVIGNVHDPATPYQGAKNLTKTLGNAELLTWDGEGHTSYLEGSSCVDKDVNAYLIDETLPPAGTTCPA
jgi:pimeloyl-ACP methyl ester carboxylesterase